MTKQLSLLVCVSCALWVSFTAPAAAQGHVQAELIAATAALRPGETFTAGIRLRMDDGWHTYWINPGDSGLGTRVEWILPPGFRAGPLRWPYPERLVVAGIASYGYGGEVTVLCDITPPADVTPGSEVTLAAKVKWLSCKEVCMPGSASLRLALPVVEAAPPAGSEADAIAAARRFLPGSAEGWTIRAGRRPDGTRLEVTPPAGLGVTRGAGEFFPLTTNHALHVAGQRSSASGAGYELVIAAPSADVPLPDAFRGVLVTRWREGGVERAAAIDVDVALPDPDAVPMTTNTPQVTASPAPRTTAAAISAAPPPAGAARRLRSIPLAMLFALVGGLLLNLMPCVFPVLSLKVMGFVQQAGEGPGRALRHGLAFAGGVIGSFWLLAGTLLALRASGQQLGWGYQLQSQTFVAALAGVFLVFGLSLFGVFEVGTSLTALGGRAERRGGLTGSFFSGLLATVVATPCTAPFFMGPALTLALSQSVVTAALIFTCLGVGMALPYVLLSGYPPLLRYVPRPGAWMESFKQFMGFLMLGTALWLLGILARHGAEVVVRVLTGLFVIAAACWVYGRWAALARPPRTRLIATIAALALACGGGALAIRAPREAAMTWVPYSAESLAKFRAAGQPVFLDFTADWCLTCKVNERVAFSSRAVQARFAELGVIAMKADWTSQDEGVGRALAAFGRNSVPLYVLYGRSAAAEPDVLPEVLSPGVVLRALDRLR